MTFSVIGVTRHWLSILKKKKLKAFMWKDVSALTIINNDFDMKTVTAIILSYVEYFNAFSNEMESYFLEMNN